MVAMVEGLTQQLDQLLKDRDDERRAELAKLRKEARAAAEAAKAVAESETETPARGGSADPSGGESSDKAAPGPKRDEHGREPKPDHLERDTTNLRRDICAHCKGEKLVALGACRA